MSDLRSHRFRNEREEDWRRLESLLGRLEKGGARRLSDAELLALPVLYRAALSSLSVARATSLDQGLVEYLESLAARAYFVVYGGRATLFEKLGRFFAVDWPAAVQALGRETMASLAVMVLGAVAAYALMLQDPSWYFAFVPEGLASGRGPEASTEYLRSTLYDNPGTDGLSVMATALFTHNAQVALLAFALGFAFCLPTALFMAMTGCMIGGFFAVFVSRGLGLELGGWLFIHGVTELFAVVLAGAAGFRIGWAMAFPGDMSRVEAAAAAGRTAGLAMAGVVLMLLVAGLLEGFARQLITSDLVRYAVAGASLVLWSVYFYWPRGRAHG